MKPLKLIVKSSACQYFENTLHKWEFKISLAWMQIIYLPSSSFMVPVPFNLNWEALGLAVPFGNPKVAPLAVFIWDPDGAATAPDMFETPGFEEVLRPKVDAVGAV